MKSLPKLILLLSALLVTFSACEDAEHEDHHDIVGVQLKVGETVLASTNGTEVTGSISLAAGASTETIYVEFLEPDGEVANSEFDEDVSLGVTIGSAQFATHTLSGSNKWSFTINGVAAGTTTLTVSLRHGGHDDFISREIPVVVTAN